jgi:prepilin signal peptidase PulO-like enzyme (type II secretory pathway)
MGKCRYCRKKISIQYPLVEIFTGILFLLIFYFTGFDFVNLIFLFYIASVLIIIFVYDLKHYLIPDKVLLPAIIITFVYRFFDFSHFLNYFGAAFFASGIFFILFFMSQGRWMGFGDVKLAILMGLILGFKNILVALFLSFFLGAIIGLIAMALQKKSLKSEIPFAPFLITGTFLALMWGEQLINWYANILQI